MGDFNIVRARSNTSVKVQLRRPWRSLEYQGGSRTLSLVYLKSYDAFKKWNKMGFTLNGLAFRRRDQVANLASDLLTEIFSGWSTYIKILASWVLARHF